jgi:F-type H+-transporting ATPase subunit b
VEFLTEASSGGQIGQIANTFGVDWPHLAAQVISFAIVCVLLHRFAYRPILRMLEERRRQIADGLPERETIRFELAQTEARRQEILMQADARATQVIEEAHAAAARVSESETQKAIAAAEQIIVKSRDAASREHAHMLSELKKQVGLLVVQATTRVTGKILTSDDQRRMAEETVKHLPKAA